MPSSSESDIRRTSEHWNMKTGPSYNWWSNEIVCRYINRLVCGKPIPGLSRGILNLAIDKAKTLNVTFNKGLSVGCGTGVKELYLLRTGIVHHMTCYDLAESRLSQARKRAKDLGLESQIEFILGDAFADFSFTKTRGQYDLIYWNNSLHHMHNTSTALEWSRIALTNGGMLILDEYIGPNFIQFSDEMLEFGNNIRRILPASKLVYPGETTDKIQDHTKTLNRPNLKRLIAKDPSEASDSENILPALKAFFPNAHIKKTGGAVYFCTLPPLYSNFDMSHKDDRDLMEMLMLLDEMYLKLHPETSLYAAALAMIY